MKNAILMISIFAILFTGANAGYICTNSTINTVSNVTKADFLFLIDVSGSMGDIISGVKYGVTQFARSLANSNINATYGLVQFGGAPEIRMPFTASFDEFQDNVNDFDANQGGGRESAFEAIRGSLPPYSGSLFGKSCWEDVYTADECSIKWRSDALKVIIIASDEDSDVPNIEILRQPNQEEASFCANLFKADGTCYEHSYYRFEPRFTPSVLMKKDSKDSAYRMYRTGTPLVLDPTYQADVQVTSDSILDNKVFVNALISKTIGTDVWDYMLPVSAYNENSLYWRKLKAEAGNSSIAEDNNTVTFQQYGSPDVASQNSDYANYDPVKTLLNLNQNGFGDSLQAKVLTKGGNMRLYDIDQFAVGNSDLINSFFAQLVRNTEEIRQDCILVPDPTTTTTTTQPQLKTSTSETTNIKTSTLESTVITSFTKGSTVLTTSSSSLLVISDTTVPVSAPSSTSTSSSPTKNLESYSSLTVEIASHLPSTDSKSDLVKTFTQTEPARLKPADNPTATVSPTIIVSGVIGALVALGALAAGVLLIKRSPRRPTAMSTGVAAFGIGGVGTNPLYATRGRYENPLYEHSMENLAASGSRDNLVSSA